MFFLKHIIRINGIKMDLKKIKIIVDWPIPKIVKKIQRFFNFVNFN